jgi:hypothetical protein
VTPEVVSRRGPIGLADLVRAVARLDASAEEARAIAKLLGIQSARRLPPEEARTDGTKGESGSRRREPKRLVQSDKRDEKHLPPESQRAGSSIGPMPQHLLIESLGTDTDSLPAWRVGATSLPLRRENAQPWALESLLEPRSTRATLAAAVSTVSDDGPVHTEALVEAVAEVRPIHPLPRRHVPTLRRGVQVLLERGDAMLPHTEDAEDVLKRLDGVVSGSLQVVSFDYDPTHVDSDDNPDGVAYKPPPPGTPVLAITQLGLRQGRGSGTWIRLASALARRGSRLIALVPTAARSVPSAVSRVIAVIAWDRTTTIASVLRALARARGSR